MGELDNNQPKAVGSHAIGPNSELQRQIAAKFSPKDLRMPADQLGFNTIALRYESATLSHDLKSLSRKLIS